MGSKTKKAYQSPAVGARLTVSLGYSFFTRTYLVRLLRAVRGRGDEKKKKNHHARRRGRIALERAR